MTYTFEHGEIRTDVENAKIGVGKDDGNLQDLLGVQVFVETAVYDNAARPLVAYHGGLFRPKATSGNTGPSTWNPGLWESVGGSSGGLNIDGTVATVPDLPAHPHGGDGTMYMVTSTGDLYIFHQHETPQWKDVGHIQGPPGPKGDTGVAGAAGGIGPKGDTGNAGTAGVKGDTGVAGADSTVAGPKGDTGATGPAGDPLQIDNTLTGTDATKALGAPQGKVLDGKIAHNHTLITSNTSELGVNTGAIATNKTEITNNAARITQLSDGMHYVGNFHPTAAAEYPVPTGDHKNGSFWVIQGLGADTLYHMSTGDLAGVNIADRDVLLWEEHAVSGKHWHVIGEAFDSHMLWEPGAHAGQIKYMGGNVGIGTTSPSEKLEVVGDVKTSGSIIQTGSGGFHQVKGGGANSYFSIDFPDATANATVLRLFRATNNTGLKAIDMYKGDNTSTIVNRFRTNGYSYINGGNVGIGTSAPSAKLHVKETTAHKPPIVVEPHEITTPGIVLKGNEGWKTAGVTGCKYRKFPDGTVELTVINSTDISGTLPSGYRPSGSLGFPTYSYVGTIGNLRVSSGGNVFSSKADNSVRVRFYADGN